MDLYMGQMADIVLGQDFLTWLWYKSETNGGSFTDADGMSFLMYFEQRVSVQGGEGESIETATVSGQMSQLREARLGLGTGKKVSKALIKVERDVEEWQFTLKADDFTLNSLKTPKVEAGNDEDDDPDAAFLEKIFLVEKCTALIDHVYEQFLAIRFGSEWVAEAAAIREWIKTAG